MKHSPGPWRVEDKGGARFIVSVPGDGYITRDVCRLDGSTMSAFDQRANAHLIAAAPALLDELERQADTLADLQRALRLLGRDVLADACTVAEQSARRTLKEATP